MNNSSFRQISQVLDKISTAKLLVDASGKILFANALALRTFQLQEQSQKETQILDLLPLHSRQEFGAAFRDFVSQGKQEPLTLNQDLFGLRGGSNEFPMEVILNLLHTSDGLVYLLTVTDNTEKNLSHQRYKVAFEQSTEGVMIANDKGEILVANPSFLNMFSYSKEELLGKNVEILLPATHRINHIAHRFNYMLDPSVRRMGSGRELYGVRKNGVEFPVEVSLAPLRSAGTTEILVTVVDVTQRKKIEEDRIRLESKIRQTQKLESLGILTGGIAHDFNNILTGIVGNAELAQMDLPPGSSIRHYLESILRASHRAADLCEQMLAYSGGGKRLHETFNLNELIESTRDLIHTTLSKNASLAINLDRKLPLITGDATQLRQVIMNLIINASEALKDSHGVITISTGVMDFLPSSSAGTNPLEEDVPAGKYVYCLVNDNGVGMSREIQEKIFDPFFTTKFTGRGLGLAAVLGIIHNHGGAIRIYSEEGVGTSFRILLPFEGNALNAEETHLKVHPVSGTVLIIDDELMVQQTIADTLTRMGFSVHTASDGLEGLELFKAHRDVISLVILDLTMPHLGGEETYTHIRKLNKQVPVIITSGFSEQDILQKFVGRGIAGFMQKPISPHRLMEQVKSTLEEHPYTP